MLKKQFTDFLGMFEETIEEFVDGCSELCDEPLDEDDIETIADEVEKRLNERFGNV